MTRRVFISDLHVESVQDGRFVRFRECLETESLWADELFVLGDLFEMWIGDDDDTELAHQACDVLARASKHTRLHVMHGNRDFLEGDGFAARTGARLIDDPFLTDDKLLLTHGDALCTDDHEYQRLRTLLRSDAWRAETLAKSLEERRAFGQSMRDASRATNANKADNIMDVNATAVSATLDEAGASIMVHGHTHRPGVHRSGAATRYVLGAWERCGWLLRQDADTFALECFGVRSPYRSAVEAQR